jgi:dolichyl-phosphate-mannose-protein mannosyltransferase
LNIVIIIYIVLYYLFSLIYLSLSNASGKIKITLYLTLFLNALLIALAISSLPGQHSYPQIFMSLCRNILVIISVLLTYLYTAIYWSIELAHTHPPTLIIITALLLLIIVTGLTKIKTKKCRCFFITLLCLLGWLTVFLLLSRALADLPRENEGLFTRSIAFILEEIIRVGVWVSKSLVKNIILIRRLIPITAIFTILISAIRRNRNLGYYTGIAATATACLAQTYIIAGNNPIAIYLYCLSGLLVMNSSFFPISNSFGNRIIAPWKRILLITLILLLALTLGLYKLKLYPVRYHTDEALGSVRIMAEAMKLNQSPSSREDRIATIKENPVALFLWQFESPNARPDPRTPIYTHLAYLCLKLFPIDFITMRISVVLHGVISVFLLYLIIRIIFNPTIALLGAYLMSICSWQLALTRLNLPYSVTNLYALICIYFFCKAFITGRGMYYFLLGALLSLSTPFYPSIKMLLLLIPIFLVFRCLIEKQFLKKNFIGILLLLGGLLLLLSVRNISLIKQFVVYGGTGSDTIFHGSRYLGLFDVIRVALHDISIATRNIIGRFFSFELFHFFSRNYIERSMSFNTILLPFSMLGFFWCLFKSREKSYSFLLIWFLFSIFPGIMTGGGEVDRRATLVIAPIMALGAIGLYLSWIHIIKAIVKKLPGERIITAIVLPLFLFILLATSSANYFYTYYSNENSDPLLRQFKSMKAFDLFLAELFYNQQLVFFSKEYKHFTPNHEANHFLSFHRYSKKDEKFIERQFEVAGQTTDMVKIILSQPRLENGFTILANSDSEMENITSQLGDDYTVQLPQTYTYPGRPTFTVTGVTATKNVEPIGKRDSTTNHDNNE